MYKIEHIIHYNNNVIKTILYHTTFRTLAYLIPDTYSKPCQIYKMMRHMEDPGVVRTVYSGIFRHRHIEGHSAILSHSQSY